MRKITMGLLMLFGLANIQAQVDTILLGFGGYEGMTVSASGDPEQSDPELTLTEGGFLPNQNAAARFLSQATLGYDLDDINAVTTTGIEDWVDAQLALGRPYTLLSKVRDYVDFIESATGNVPNSSNRMWSYAWWNYHMSSDDVLRQRVALALSEILVVSDKSAFGNNGYALSDYYDILLNNAFGNYRDIMEEVTYHAAMGVYLTYMNNPKTDVEENQFPDENYSRELMQLFTIGLFELNDDGSLQVDENGEVIPTYDNLDIIEFSKIFTGLTWADRDRFGRGALRDTSYLPQMTMWNEHHEPGVKNLLNGYQVVDRNPVDGDADISDALDNLFNHPNVGPFIGKLLIQRLVTSNPSPEFVGRVTAAFNDNGNGVRGDMSAVVKAILLDPEANTCRLEDEVDVGKLREPFIRYVHINKAFYASTISGEYRNDMDEVEYRTGQKPLTSPSVFNFFQPDYQPLGDIEAADLVAPEFQITDAQTITGWLDAVYEWIVDEDISDEYDIYSGEPNENYADEISSIDYSTFTPDATDGRLHILLDRLNLILAQGRLTAPTNEMIIAAVKEFDDDDEDDLELRAKVAIYLVLSSPEYLINR